MISYINVKSDYLLLTPDIYLTVSEGNPVDSVYLILPSS